MTNIYLFFLLALVWVSRVAGGPPDKKKIRYREFIKKRERKKIRGGKGLCEEEVVGRVVEGGGKIIKTIKKRRRRDRERREKEK